MKWPLLKCENDICGDTPIEEYVVKGVKAYYCDNCARSKGLKGGLETWIHRRMARCVLMNHVIAPLVVDRDGNEP